jgi:hypothetical protein
VNIDKAMIIERFFMPDEDATTLLATWNESLASFPGVANMPFIQDEFIIKYGKLGDLTDETIKTVIHDKNNLIKDELLLSLLWHCVGFLKTTTVANKNKNIAAIPQLEKILPKLYGNFFLLLVLARFPQAIKFYEEKQLPLAVMNATLKDLNIWIEQYQRERGITGLTHRILGWLQGHLTGGLFKIGRLQFQYPYAMIDGIMAFKHQLTGEIQLLSAADIRYNGSGLIDGVGDVWDETKHWISTVKETSTTIIGNPINPQGFAEPTVIELEFKLWDKVLQEGDPVLNIHIPAGEPMTPAACSESFELAREFFGKYFSDYDFKAFVCFSWLLDSQFNDILKPTSNIIKFQHLGRIWPIQGESEAIYRIFGPQAEADGIDVVPHVSSMQRAIAAFIHAGGILRNGGFLLLK